MDWKLFFKPDWKKALVAAILAIIVLPSAFLLLTGTSACSGARGDCSELLAFPLLLLSFWFVVAVVIVSTPIYLMRPGTEINVPAVLLFVLALAGDALLSYFLACAILQQRPAKRRKGKARKKRK